MGVAYYITTEKKIKGFQPEDFDGKSLAEAEEYFEKKVYAAAGVQSLMDFMGDDPRDILGDEGFEDVPEENIAERWFAAADGLKTVRVLIEHLQAKPDVVPSQNIVLKELQELEQILVTCDQMGLRWHLSMDI